MRNRFTYCILPLFLALAARNGSAQSCEKNMLQTPNASSYAIIPNPKGISLPGAFTIEFWAQSSSFAPHSGLIEKVNKGDTGAFSIGFSSGSSLAVTLHLNTGIVTLTTPNIQNIQNWQHYALTFTPNDSIRVYINSILIVSQKTTATNLITSGDSILIAHSNQSGITFTGNIDELRFWSAARTSAEIFATMTTALSGKETGLKAYYSFDDDPAGATIHDFTGGKSEAVVVSSAALTASTSPVTGTTSGYMLASKEMSVIFPDLICANEADTVLHIYNRGLEVVEINPPAFQTGTVFSSAATVLILPADSTRIADVHIQANPINPGLYRDTLLIRSTTVCGGTLRIPVELRYQKIGIAFGDSVFDLRFGSRDLLPCDLPDTGQTSLKNTGTKAVEIVSLQFSSQAGINIVSPKTPFTINAGKIQVIKFAVLPGSPGPLNTILTAKTNECSRIATIRFQGKRIIPEFSIPDHITFPDVHLPAPGIAFNTTIILKNNGTSTLSFTNPPIKLEGGSQFNLLSPKSGLATLRPDSSLSIKIRFTPNDCGVFGTLLHLQDQSNCGIDTLIPISITVLGPDVSGISSNFDLGASCGAHDTVITLFNKSGRPIVLGNPVFSKDSILSVINSILPISLASGDSVSITIHFAPPEPGRYNVNARFPLSPCGDSYIHFQGISGVGLITLSDSSLDFGTGCDISAQTRKLTITNKCGRQITVTNSALQGSQNFSIISPSLPFAIANNSSKDVIIQFTPQKLGVSEQALINLEDSGCFVTRFAAHGVRERAKVAWSYPGFAEFGTVCPGRIATTGITLQNSGFGDDTVLSYRLIEKGTFVFNAANIKGEVIEHGAGKQFFVTFSPKDTGEFIGSLEVVLAPCGDTTLISLHGIGGPAAQLSVSDTVLDFRTIRVGSTDSACTILTNPSCLPLRISPDSIHNTNFPFALSQSTRSILPDSVVASSPLAICFVFAPNKIGSFETTDTIRIGNQRKIITLRGAAGISDLKYSQRVIDFGDVLKDSINKKALIIHNNGSFPASLKTVKEPSPDFSHTTDAQTIGATSSDTIEFQPKNLGLQENSIVYGWEDHLDTIILRGRGIQPGLSFGSSLIDFSKVRVGHDSVISVALTNTLDTTIRITSDSITGKFTVSPTGSKILFPHETQYYAITYSPDAETIDTASLYLITNFSGIAILPLHGEGVEAHLAVDTTSIDFGDVGLQQTAYHTLKVSNSGGYPLTITNIHKRLAEFDTSTKGVFVLLPNSAADYILSFTPQRAIRYFDTLRIDADAPEKSAIISMTGKGVFKPLGIPEVTYSIPDKQAKVGDIVEIPISIGGKDLSLFNMDSFRVDLAYDPTVIYFLDTTRTDGTLSSGFTMRFERLSHDSIIRISGSGKQIVATPGRLFVLKAMALLGPHDSTRISVPSSDPINTASVLSSSGSFVITDCNNYRGGILFKGNYSVSQVNPNPVSSIAHIDYEIGLPGRVHLDLYDALGRHSKTIIDDDQTKGKHSATFSSDDIPSGEYIYVFKSLEYESRGALIIAK